MKKRNSNRFKKIFHTLKCIDYFNITALYIILPGTSNGCICPRKRVRQCCANIILSSRSDQILTMAAFTLRFLQNSRGKARFAQF